MFQRRGFQIISDGATLSARCGLLCHQFIRQIQESETMKPMKIDAFCHILPHNFHERLGKLSEKTSTIRMRALGIPCMTDLDIRFRMMDRFENYVQVVSLAAPPIESLGDPKQTAELA